MTISRHGFIAGLALTGAAAPAAFYAHREWTREAFPITPGEATVDLADTAGQHLANTLRGVWNLRLEGRDAGLKGLPTQGLALLLDVAPRGRGLRGYLDTAEHLRADGEPRYRVLGDLLTGEGTELYWRLIDRDAADGAPAYEFNMTVDEVWGVFGNAGSGTLSGQILDLARPLALTEPDNRFVAHKQLFPEARQRIGLNPSLLAWLISPSTACSTNCGTPPAINGTSCPRTNARPCAASAGSPAHAVRSAKRGANSRIATARASTSSSCTATCSALHARCRTCRRGLRSPNRNRRWNVIAWASCGTSITTTALPCRPPGGHRTTATTPNGSAISKPLRPTTATSRSGNRNTATRVTWPS